MNFTEKVSFNLMVFPELIKNKSHRYLLNILSNKHAANVKKFSFRF